jgi:hypothetical protein
MPQFDTFPTKGEAKKYFQGLLWGAELDAPIGEPGASRLHDFIKHHPEFVEIQGVGIAHFRAHKTLATARGFQAVRTNGSIAEFSIYTCLNRRKTDRRRIHEALRVEVELDIRRAKDNYFAKYGDELGLVKCAVAGERISRFECHADHAPPRTFANLADDFIAARHEDFDYCRFCFDPDDPYRPRLRDRALAERWRAYHHKQAHIRIVSSKANLSASRAGVPNPKDKQLDLGSGDDV